MIELLFEKNQICEEEEYNGYASRDCDFFQFQSTKNPTTCFRTQKKTITKPMKTKVNKPIQKPMMAELERDFENISIQKNSNLRNKNNAKPHYKKKSLPKPHTLSDLGKKLEKVDLNEKKPGKIDLPKKTKLEDFEKSFEKLTLERQFSRRFSATLKMESIFSGEHLEECPVAINAEVHNVYPEDSVNNL